MITNDEKSFFKGGMELSNLHNSALFNEQKLIELHQIANGNRDFLAKIAHTYTKQFESKFPELKQAVQASDGAQVEQLAHLLKGASYSVGLERTAESFHALEVAGETNRLEGATDHLRDIEEQMTRFTTEWEHYFDNQA